MHFNWIWYIAGRYIFRKQSKAHSTALSIVGIATGVFALIVIIAVMNGFQLGFIESILEISSYHLRIGPLPPEKIVETREAVMAVPGVEAVVPFQEFQGLVRVRRGGQQAVIVRGVPADVLSMDAGMAGRLDFENGYFDLGYDNSVLLGAELARKLGVRPGDDLTIYSIAGIFSTDESDEGAGFQTYTVGGLFRTGYYEYDSSWALINIQNAAVFSDRDPVLGVKLKNRFNDRQMLEQLRKSFEGNPGFASAEFSGWRDYNRSFFGALRTEKLFMFILVGLIFIVVGLNIYQAQRRTVLERREEIGLLRAVGGGERAVRLIFVCDGAIIGFAGAAAGMCLGLLIASNISAFFTIIEAIVNFFINIVNIVVEFLLDKIFVFFLAAPIERVDNFAFFSPAVFYIREIPSRIIPQEIVLICLFGFLSALLAGWFASRKVSQIHPAEVLRYE